ncbi:hypothetical protein [Tepidimonas charontis]|uniref:hypothetical protein n=1 Tax=Tepidimonas charontis TaxID=2267262 RepID=UPI0011869ECD|nr:hypothetical protein [Tepidimonas charontis]
MSGGRHDESCEVAYSLTACGSGTFGGGPIHTKVGSKRIGELAPTNGGPVRTKVGIMARSADVRWFWRVWRRRHLHQGRTKGAPVPHWQAPPVPRHYGARPPSMAAHPAWAIHDLDDGRPGVAVLRPAKV